MKPTIISSVPLSGSCREHQLRTTPTVRKKLITSIFLVFGLLFIGCSSESNSSQADPVQGQWKLVNVTGTFAGINHNFNPGLITWSFNSITQTVTIVNNNTDDSKWDVFETGVYNYQIVAAEQGFPCNDILKIDGSEMGCFTISGNTLVIDQSVADGFTIHFTD